MLARDRIPSGSVPWISSVAIVDASPEEHPTNKTARPINRT
jgi:hypothetical protein